MARTPDGGDYSPSEPLDNKGSLSREDKPWHSGDSEHTNQGNNEAESSNHPPSSVSDQHSEHMGHDTGGSE